MLDRLAKAESAADSNYSDLTLALRVLGKSHFFLLENSIYVLKDEFTHPGGQFILPRIDRGHITKYYYGISPMKNTPYPNMVHLHSSPIPSDICREKINVPTSTLWVRKHPNLLLTTSTWKKDHSWRVLSVQQLSKVHMLFWVRPKNFLIEGDEIEDAIRNFGKILLCQLKHHADFKYSFLHLSSFDTFAANRKRFYHTILNKASIPVFQKGAVRSQGVLINFSRARKLDVVQSDIQNKFAKKYFNEMFDEPADAPGNLDRLPLILKLKDMRRFFDALNRDESAAVRAQFLAKKNEPVVLASKIKMAVGGPFGWENLLEEGRETVIFCDSDGIYALDDLAYSLLHSMHVVLTSSDADERKKHEKRLSMGLHVIFKTSADKMDTLTEFLLAFYFFEQTTKKGFLKSLFVFTADNLLTDYIGANGSSLATAYRHIIIGKYKNAYVYFKQIKKLVNKNQIMFV